MIAGALLRGSRRLDLGGLGTRTGNWPIQLGFAREENADFLFYSMVAFLDRMLLKKGEAR